MLSAPPHVTSLLPLSQRTLSGRGLRFGAAGPSYDRARLRAGIAHIGVGNFHRVHQAVYIDRCLHLPGHEDCAIVGIGLGDGDAARASLRSGDPLAVLSLSPFRALGLAGHPRLTPACLALAGSLRRRGVRATLAELVA